MHTRAAPEIRRPWNSRFRCVDPAEWAVLKANDVDGLCGLHELRAPNERIAHCPKFVGGIDMTRALDAQALGDATKSITGPPRSILGGSGTATSRTTNTGGS